MPEDELILGRTLATHLHALVDKRLQRLAECRHFGRTEDPGEALHDLRVASRRLRAFGDVFCDSLGRRRHRKIDDALKRVIGAAGRARDWDVQIALSEALRTRATSNVEQMALEYLLEQEDVERARAVHRAKKGLRRVDFEELCSSVRASFYGAIDALPQSAPTLRAFARGWLEHFVSNGEAHELPVDPVDGSEQPETMHRLRIDLKKLRYALELFEPILGTGYPRLYGRTSELQELLGSHHDLVVLGDFVERQRRDLAEKRRPALSSSMGVLHETLVLERVSIATRYADARFDADFWRAGIRSALGDYAANGASTHVRDS